MRDVTSYIQAKQQATADEQVADQWAKIDDFYNKKLWHQLTVQLLQFIKHPIFQQGDELVQLYKNFISEFEHRINPLSLMELAFIIVKQIEEKDEAIKFLASIKEKIKANKEAVLLCLTAAGSIRVRSGELDECKQVLKQAEELLDEWSEVGGIGPVHGRYYNLSAEYHKLLGEHAEFYRDTLRFLGCTDLEELNESDRAKRALELALAALLGKGVYNFGELLAHPILNSLKSKENQWLVDLLLAFNRGDIKEWNTLKIHWSKVPDLVKHEKDLKQKIMLLCLMEMTFQREAKSRQLTFSQIAEKTGLPNNQVEMLVMKALSLGLVKGSIDEVERKVHMTWVQPRVLDHKQIESMRGRLTEWSGGVRQMENLLESNAHEILDKMYH